MAKQSLITVAISMAALFSSCKIFESAEKKDQRKDITALQRVMAKRLLADSVYLAMVKFYPCQNIVTKLIPGKIDSIPYPVYQVDQQRIYSIADSIRNVYAEDYEEAMRQAAQAAYDECVSKYTKQKIARPAPDTAWYEDTRMIDAYKTEADGWKLKYTAAQAAIDSMKQDKKGKLQLQLWHALLFSIIFIIIGFLTGRYGR